MLTRSRLARSPWFTRLALLGWKIGLGWLIGRRFVLLTTIDEAGDRRHSLVPFVFAGGDLYTVAYGDERWIGDVARRPLAMAQAHPGPLGVRVRRADPGEEPAIDSILDRHGPDLLAVGTGTERYVLAASGDPTPTLVPPDHVWVWPAVLIGLVVRRRLRRAGCG